MPNKPLREDAMTGELGIRITPAQKTKLAQLAKHARTPMSELLRQLLEYAEAGVIDIASVGTADPHDPKSEMLGIRVTAEQKAALARMAQEAEVSMSDVLRHLIAQVEGATIQLTIVGESESA